MKNTATCAPANGALFAAFIKVIDTTVEGADALAEAVSPNASRPDKAKAAPSSFPRITASRDWR
jgi:hypothetical protein